MISLNEIKGDVAFFGEQLNLTDFFFHIKYCF